MNSISNSHYEIGLLETNQNREHDLSAQAMDKGKGRFQILKESLLGDGSEKKIKIAIDCKKNKERATYTVKATPDNLLERKICELVSGQRGLVKTISIETYSKFDFKQGKRVEKIRCYQKKYNLGSLNNVKKLTRKEKMSMIEDLLHGLNFLHEKKIIHRDIKPQNILVHKRSTGEIIAVIADFGITCFTDDVERKKNIACSPEYQPPEFGLSYKDWIKLGKKNLENLTRPKNIQEFLAIDFKKLAAKKKKLDQELEFLEEIDKRSGTEDEKREDERIFEAITDDWQFDYTEKNTQAVDVYGIGKYVFKPLLKGIGDQDQPFFDQWIEKMTRRNPEERITIQQALQLFKNYKPIHS